MSGRFVDCVLGLGIARCHEPTSGAEFVRDRTPVFGIAMKTDTVDPHCSTRWDVNLIIPHLQRLWSVGDLWYESHDREKPECLQHHCHDSPHLGIVAMISLHQGVWMPICCQSQFAPSVEYPDELRVAIEQLVKRWP